MTETITGGVKTKYDIFKPLSTTTGAATPLAPEEEVKAPPSKYDIFTPLSRQTEVKRELKAAPEPPTAETLATEDPAALKKTPVAELSVHSSPSDLRNDEVAMKDIRTYMEQRYGAGGSLWRGESYQYTQDQSDDEVFDMYMTSMRKFNAGQSVTVLNELAFMNGADDETLLSANKAYDLFDSIEGSVFSEDYTWGETFSGVGTYMRAAIIDPTNLIGLGVGGAAAKAGGKSTTVLVKKMAQEIAEGAIKRVQTKAATEALKRAGGKALTTEAAAKLTAEASKKALTKEAESALFAKTYQKAVEKAFAKTTIQTAARKEAYAGAAVSAATDTTLNMGVIAAQQETLVTTGNQLEHEATAYALGLAGGLVTGGIGAALVKMSDLSKPALLTGKYVMHDTPENNARVAANQMKTKDVALDLDFNLKALVDNPPEHMKWIDKKTAGGAVMRREKQQWMDQDLEIIDFIFNGNPEAGVKGLVKSMADAGLRRVGTRWHEDNVTNYLLDVMKHVPKEYKDKMEASFRSTIGTRIPRYKDMSMEDFINLTARKVSDAGRTLSFVSKAAKTLRENPTTADIIANTAEELVPSASLIDKTMGKVGYLQNNLVRAIVTHPGTVALNFTGGVVYGAGEVGKDLIKATLHGGAAGLKLLSGKGDAKASFGAAKAILASQKDKFRNLFDPLATHEEFMSYLAVRDEPRKAFQRFLSGGDEAVSAEDAIKRFGFDPKQNIAAQGMEKTLDVFQTLYGAKLADNFMKSQSFMFHMGQKIRTTYGEDFATFINRKDAYDVMQSPQFFKLEAEATEETLRATFSKSYSKPGMKVIDAFSQKDVLKTVATGIEEFRRIPVLGASVPFGRFFNNSVALMGDLSGASILYKALSKDVPRDYTELFSRAIAGYGFIGMKVAAEVDAMHQGLAWYEVRNADGSISDLRYDYPLSYIQYMSRVAAHMYINGEVPDDLMLEFGKTFGTANLTRNFSTPEQTIANIFDTYQTEGVASSFGKAFGGIVSQYVSGYTRFIDPLNQLAALGRGEDYEPADRKQGNETLNNSLRYVDNIFNATISAISGEDYDMAPAKRSITREGSAPLNPTATLSIRESAPTTYAQRVLNIIGVQPYTVDAKEGDPAVNARVNEVASFYAEKYAKNLWENPKFQNGSASYKKEAAQKAFNQAKQDAKSALSVSTDSADRVKLGISKLHGSYKDKEIGEAMTALGVEDKQLSDMTPTQLDMIDMWLKAKNKDIESLIK